MSDDVNVNDAGEEFLDRQAVISGGPARLYRTGSSQERLLAIQARQRLLIASDPRAQALRLQLDDRNTDKYYRGGQVSAIGPQSISDTPTRPGGHVVARSVHRPVSALDERNTDRYYRDSLVRGPTRQQIQQAAMKQQRPESTARRGRQILPQGTTLSPVEHSQHVHPLVVAGPEDVRPAIDEAVARLNAGAPRVVIKIVGAAGLVMKVQTLVDGLVTRSVLTEERVRDVKLDTSELGVADAPAGARTPEDVIKSLPTRQARTDDPEEFLSDDEKIRGTGTPVDGDDEEDDEEDNDFLSSDVASAPTSEVTPSADAGAKVETPAEATPAGETSPQPAQQRRGKKRRHR